jgi:hypothetical protein
MEKWLAAFIELLPVIERWLERIGFFQAGKKVQEGEQIQNTLEAVEASQEARESVRNDTNFTRLRRAQAAGRLRGVSATEYESE